MHQAPPANRILIEIGALNPANTFKIIEVFFTFIWSINAVFTFGYEKAKNEERMRFQAHFLSTNFGSNLNLQPIDNT